MTAEPWRADEPPLEPPYDEEDEAFLNAMHDKAKLSDDVAIKLHRLRVDELARQQLRAEKVTEADYGKQFLTRAELLNLPAPEPLIGGVLPRHAYAILRGRDHSFKSFVAIDWALHLATGKPWQDHTVPNPTRVLYVAGEGAHGLANRIDAWEYAWGLAVPDDMFTVRRTALDLHHPGPAFDHLLEHVRTGGYGLVIVDTLRRVSGAADGNSSEMGLVVDNLDRIKHATQNGTVLAVAHTDKGDNDTRGYSGIEDDADVVWAAKRDDLTVHLELTKMKDGPDGRHLTLAAQPSLNSLVISAGTGTPEADLSKNQAIVLDTVRAVYNGGASFPDLTRVLVDDKDRRMSRATLGRVLTDLLTTGALINTGTKRARFYELPALEDPTQEPAPANDTPDTQLELAEETQ